MKNVYLVHDNLQPKLLYNASKSLYNFYINDTAASEVNINYTVTTNTLKSSHVQHQFSTNKPGLKIKLNPTSITCH